ncbi:MAG: hypothetical protein KC729_21055, partial [Candidatus Eisenbacteria bacterium]|nr:hypothetical protein [Candidatus Eisenbacteria bacterium]
VNTNVTSYFDDGATPLYPHSYCVAAMIADGTEVSELGSYGLGGTDIVAAGNIATVATGGHVYVLDVPDPGAVSVAAQFPTTPGPTRLASNWPLVNGVDGAGRVYMFFVGDGTNASFLGSATTPGTAEDLAMFDKWGFIADGGAGLSVYAMEEFPDFRDQISIAGFAKSVAFRHEAPYVGGYAYVATTGATHEITTVFVPNPETPGTSSVLGSVSLPGSPEDVAISGDYLFVASRTGGVHVLDISIPSAPSLVTTIGSPDITDARRISIEGSRAYVADGSDGLAVLELGRLGHPQIAASFSGGQGNGVAVAGDRAYFLRDSDLALLQLPVDITSDVDCTVGIRGTIEPPTDISATYGHYLDRIVISWADNSSDETGFRIKQAGGGPIIDVGPNVTSYEDTSVSQYTEYTYEVYVLDGNGNEVFGGSVIGIAGPGTMHGPIYATASQGTYEDRIELIWEDAPDEEFYSIVRESDTEPPVEIATVPANTTTYDDPVPEGDKDYYYSIIAKSNHGGSSTPDEGSQPLGMMENVFPPDNLVATDGDFEDHVHLSWENRSAKAV